MITIFTEPSKRRIEIKYVFYWLAFDKYENSLKLMLRWGGGNYSLTRKHNLLKFVFLKMLKIKNEKNHITCVGTVAVVSRSSWR